MTRKRLENRTKELADAIGLSYKTAEEAAAVLRAFWRYETDAYQKTGRYSNRLRRLLDNVKNSEELMLVLSGNPRVVRLAYHAKRGRVSKKNFNRGIKLMWRNP